jgi:parallel beta-helix repeat protein
MVKKLVLSVIVVLLVSLVAGLQAVEVARANFLPPPPELPYVYIRSDGTVEPSILPIMQVGDIYTLTGNIANYTIEIQRSNIVLNGAGYTLQGNSSGRGIVLSNVTNVTVTGLKLKNLRTAIGVANSTGNTLAENTISGTELGIYLYSSSNSKIEKNNISQSNIGILLYEYSNNNIITKNSLKDNGFGSIALEFANNHTSNYNTITQNTIDSKGTFGISISSSYNCRIEQNNITSSEYGMQFRGSMCKNNQIVGNIITNNSKYAIAIGGDVNHNIFSQNTLANSKIGLDIFGSNNNEFYRNNFVNNKRQVNNGYVDNEIHPVSVSINTWDKNTKGNFWSDYNGTDQNSDGIGDTSYVIDSANRDRYPLIEPFGNIPQDLLLSPNPTTNTTGTSKPTQSATPNSTPTTTPTSTLSPSPLPTVPELPSWSPLLLIAIVTVVTVSVIYRASLKKNTRGRFDV